MLRSALMAQKLFPVPSVLRSKLSPAAWAGVNPESTKTLRKVLEDNHDKWHVYFNEEGFHNHASHHVIATWALGANGKVIQAAYESNEQRPAFKSPEPITKENFSQHLGDDRYYNAYMEYFQGLLAEKDISAILEEHFFTPKANFPDGVARENDPLMLNRLLDSLYHPMIHVGYGLEFGIPGMLIEGLAQASIHQALWPGLIPPSKFRSDSLTPKSSVHIFDILAEMAQDPRFVKIENKDPETMTVLYDVYFDHEEAVRAYADKWSVNTADTNDARKKLEELIWLVTIIYGIGGWKKAERFNADFFYMHLVTSSIFLSSYLEYLSPASQKKLLESYCTFTLLWWVARGRPELDITGFFSADVPSPTTEPNHPTPSADALVGPSVEGITPNPWFPIIQNTVVHPDNHIAKLQRALAHYSTLYGNRVAGEEDFASTKLDGADKLDGSLFIRVASLTAERLGRVRDGEKADTWDRDGFYYKA